MKECTFAIIQIKFNEKEKDNKEVGNYDSLMKLNGKYAVLYNSQFA